MSVKCSDGRARTGGRIGVQRSHASIHLGCALLALALLAGHDNAQGREDCMLMMHSDGTYENGYAWEADGCVPPEFGAFAERYEGRWEVLQVILDLTSITWPIDPRADIYIWGDDAGAPGSVLLMVSNVPMGYIPQWPWVGRNVIELPEPLCVDADWWVGFWGRWELAGVEFFIAADLDGPGGGFPATKIASGQGYPTGWQNVSVRWGPTAALGIGAEVDSCPPTPVESETWGSIKALYR